LHASANGRTLGRGNHPQRWRADFKSLRGPDRPSRKRRRGRSGRLDETDDEAVRRVRRGLLDEIERRIEDLEEEIEEHIEENPKLMDRCSLLDTIPGIGLQTAAIIAGELGSPERFESAR
jgi:transposase